MGRVSAVPDIEVLRSIGEGGASTESIRGACKFTSLQGARVRVRKLVKKGLVIEQRMRRGKVVYLHFSLADAGRGLLLELLSA